MAKFKVGDRVKTRFGIGKIVEINKKILCPYLVYHNSWNQGHDGNGYSKKEYLGNHCCWFEEFELKLVESQITSEIKRDSSGIEVMLRNPITDKYDDLLKALEKLKKKEGNDMLESLNLVDLYASKQKEKINNKYLKMIENIRNKSSIQEQYDKIIQNCINELDNLIKTVKAHVSIAKTKEEVEEILTRYKILEKGVLVTK